MGQISKRDAARRQLLAAIHLHWYLDEPIAVYTLASNAWEICDALLKGTGGLRMKAGFAQAHGLSEKHFVDVFNEPRNFVKHADRDPTALAEDISVADCDAVVEAACVDYLVLGPRSPISFGLFIAWYSAVYPDKTGDFFREMADQLFPGLAALERKSQIHAARLVLHQQSSSSELLHDMRNEMTDNFRWAQLRGWGKG